MPIIAKPSPLEKDATGVFTLDKTALALHPLVSGSAHFSSPNVWDKIILKYKSETLGQFESVEFDATLASPEGQFFVSATAEDVFEVEKITIIDKDGAILLIPRADLTVAEFDIDFEETTPSFTGTYIDWTERSDYTPELDGGIISTLTTPDSSVGSLIYGDNSARNPVNGQFSLVYKLNKQDFNTSDFRFLGITDSGKATYTGFYKDSTTGLNKIIFLRQNSSAGAFTIDAFSDPLITELLLKMTISENGVEYFVNNQKIDEYILNGLFLSSGSMIPAARVYSGMEVLETYFE